MLFRTPEQKRDLEWGWNRGERAFFAAGACHVLTYVFLQRYPQSRYRPWMILPADGFRGGHVFAGTEEIVFDYHGFTARGRYLAHFREKMQRIFPGWHGELIKPDEFMESSFLDRYAHRAPDQFHQDPLPRAEAFIERLVGLAKSKGIRTELND